MHEGRRVKQKGGRTEKRGGKANNLKKGWKLGSGVGALKKGGLEPPYELWLNDFAISPRN